MRNTIRDEYVCNEPVVSGKIPTPLNRKSDEYSISEMNYFLESIGYPCLSEEERNGVPQ